MKKARYVLLLLFGGLLLNCCPDVEPATIAVEIEELSVQNYLRTDPLRPLANEDVINTANYSIVLIPDAPSLNDIETKERNGLFRSPDCSSEVDPIFIFEDKITEVTIFTDTDLSAEYPSGTNIIDLFIFASIMPPNEFGAGNMRIFEEDKFEQINGINESNTIETGYNRNQQLSSFFGFNFNFFSQLSEENIFPLETNFTVELTFESGRILSAKTPLVTIVL